MGIIMRLYRAQGKTASGIYGGRLEKYIPMMFE